MTEAAAVGLRAQQPATLHLVSEAEKSRALQSHFGIQGSRCLADWGPPFVS